MCTQVRGSLTDDLEASVRVELSNVSSAEPSLASLIHKKVVTVFAFALEVTHRYVGTADQNLPPWVWLVCAVVTTYRSTNLIRTKTSLRLFAFHKVGLLTHPHPSPSV